jgi:hypothetical protein
MLEHLEAILDPTDLTPALSFLNRMDRFTLRRGFTHYWDAKAFADELPTYALAKVVPYITGKYAYEFAVEVGRYYIVTFDDSE